MFLVLSIILFSLLALIGKKRGVKTFCTLYLNYFFIIVAITLICWGANPVVIGLIFSLGTSAFILFFLNGINVKTKVAYIATIMVLLLVTTLIIFVVYHGKLHGFTIETGEVIFVFNTSIRINYIYVTIAVVLMGLTGAITDTALDIATSLNEVYENNRSLSFQELLKSGKNIGGDILGTMFNTLFFVFIGEFMGFFLLFYGSNLASIVNHKLFAMEMTQLLLGSLGCTLIIPITVLIQAWAYTSSSRFLMKIKRG